MVQTRLPNVLVRLVVHSAVPNVAGKGTVGK